mgnify:CR=1 FL=1
MPRAELSSWKPSGFRLLVSGLIPRTTTPMATARVASADPNRVAVLISQSPGLFMAMKVVGAGYLIYLGYRSLRTRAPVALEGAAGGTGRGAWGAFASGFLTNALNPKVALFVLAFLPQFTDPARGPVWQQILILGAVFTATGMVITSGYGALAGYAGQALAARMGVMNKLAAGVFALLALRMMQE